MYASWSPGFRVAEPPTRAKGERLLGTDLTGGRHRGTHFPPSEPGRHGIADVLRLVDQVRAVAFDRTLSDGDVARRVRDLLRKHDGEDLGDND